MDILIKQYKLFNNDNFIINYICKNNIMVYGKLNENNNYNESNESNESNENNENKCLCFFSNETLLLFNFKKKSDNIQKEPIYINCDEIVYKYDENNLRIPYYNNKKIFAIKINLKEIFNFISSTLFIYDNQIICGEYIQNLADIVIGTKNSLLFNSNNIIFSKEMCTIDELTNISKYKFIFVFTHDLEEFYKKFEKNLFDKILISHNSDHGISYIKNIKLHLAQNCLINNSNLVPLPIGIQNTQWFDHNIFSNIRKMNIKKSKDIYFYFNMDTHSSRYNCYNILKNKLEWNVNRNKVEYFIELSKHKYAICPRGNGIDTHRIWECLYLNVIPIVLKEDNIKIDNLPIIFIDKWEDIDNINFLNIQFKNQELNKITINYYKNILEKFL